MYYQPKILNRNSWLWFLVREKIHVHPFPYTPLYHCLCGGGSLVISCARDGLKRKKRRKNFRSVSLSLSIHGRRTEKQRRLSPRDQDGSISTLSDGSISLPIHRRRISPSLTQPSAKDLSLNPLRRRLSLKRSNKFRSEYNVGD